MVRAKKIADVEIRTDSTEHLAWVLGKKVGKKINDREAVLALKTSMMLPITAEPLP